MRPHLIPVVAALLLAAAPARAEIFSAYSDIDTNEDCTQFAGPEDGEGDWGNFVCDGYKGYPVFLYYGDARDSLFYGFPPAGDVAPAWESFSAFNHSSPKIEWRVERTGSRAVPYATIHRWFVSDPEDADKKVEVLVVEKVGQPYERDGCAVAYVMATGNQDSNEKARRYADEFARDFACGADQPAIDAGTVPLPDFTRDQ
ncbi:MAG: hypothetical protein KF849_02595 [Rhizobiaceae bacterium]|nr:hypothetical protein [Rhizobiaceae bacterium]